MKNGSEPISSAAATNGSGHTCHATTTTNNPSFVVGDVVSGLTGWQD